MAYCSQVTAHSLKGICRFSVSSFASVYTDDQISQCEHHHFQIPLINVSNTLSKQYKIHLVSWTFGTYHMVFISKQPLLKKHTCLSTWSISETSMFGKLSWGAKHLRVANYSTYLIT